MAYIKRKVDSQGSSISYPTRAYDDKIALQRAIQKDEDMLARNEFERNNSRKKHLGVDASDRPPLKYQMRFTRKQWEAIEWAIDCGISAATTQFSEDKETVALVPVLQSVLDEINNRA